MMRIKQDFQSTLLKLDPPSVNYSPQSKTIKSNAR